MTPAGALWHQAGVKLPVLVLALLSAATLSAQTLDADPPLAADQAAFATWVGNFRTAAINKGMPAAAVDATLAGVRFSPRVVELDRAQPDDSAWKPSVFATYLERRLEPVRIGRGRAVAAELRPALDRIAAQSGVPVAIILGVWGMESSYGTVTGSFDVPQALASLAYDGRRRDLFTRELEATVTIVARGLADRSQLRGSWAGAMGQPQFLPSSFLAHATDGDGDGRADIWNSRADVAASIATYLQHAGWRRGESWGMRVTVPDTLDRDKLRNLFAPKSCVRPMEKHSRWLSVGEWRALGLTQPSGLSWPADETQATLVEPDGPGTPAFLTFHNYRALLDYNCSNFYALSVALLGDALR